MNTTKRVSEYAARLLMVIGIAIFGLSFAEAAVTQNGLTTTFTTTSAFIPVSPGVLQVNTVDSFVLGIVDVSSISFTLENAGAASYDANFNGVTGTFAVVETSPGSGEFSSSDASLISQVLQLQGNVLTATLTGASTAATNVIAFNVNAVPEPSSVMLLGIATIGLIARRKRA